MKPQKKLVKDLSETVGPHSIRLKVIEKSNTQISPRNKELHYQRIVFQDEEGSKIRTTLYEDEIAAYENVIFDKMEYEICNAKIKMLPEKYRRNAEHPYQLAFGAQTIIMPVEGCKPPMGPEYISIASIPRIVIADDRYDVVAILIHVEMLREVPRTDGGDLALRELVVLDASTEQPLIITAWSELATKEGEQLKAIVETFPVIGFTCLKPSNHKGFSVSTTTATFVKFNPDGEKAEALQAWKTANSAAIYAKHQQVLGAREAQTGRTPTTIRNLRAKKAVGTLQDERHWLCVSIPEFDRKDVRFYLGCNHCGASSKKDFNDTYKCETCRRERVTSVPRMTITFEAIDQTGSFMFTAFNIDAEKLLKKSAVELYAMPSEDKLAYLQDAEETIRNISIYIQAGPSAALSRNGVLKWVIKQLSLE